MTWILRANDYRHATLGIRANPCTKKTVVILSLKKLTLFWGLAAFSIFIPILHFVLVPAFLIIGVYTFNTQYKNTHLLEDGTATCPACQKNFFIKASYIFEGKKLICELCMEQLTLKDPGTV